MGAQNIGGCKGTPTKKRGAAKLGAQSIGGCKGTPTKKRGWRKAGGAKEKREYRDSYYYESQESFVN